MTIASAGSIHTPISPIVARFVDTEVAGMYHAEVRVEPRTLGRPDYPSVQDAIDAARLLSAGEDVPAVAVVREDGHARIHAMSAQWRDLQSGEFTTGRGPLAYEGYDDAYVERTPAGRSLEAVVDGDTVYDARG